MKKIILFLAVFLAFSNTNASNLLVEEITLQRLTSGTNQGYCVGSDYDSLYQTYEAIINIFYRK